MGFLPAEEVSGRDFVVPSLKVIDLFVLAGVAPPGEDDEHKGVFRRLSSMLPSIRKGRRDSECHVGS